jgi:O-antigen/teichoic acid export membrane protein
VTNKEPAAETEVPVKTSVQSAGTPRGVSAIRLWLIVQTSTQLRRNALAGALAAIIGAGISGISYPVYLHFLGYEQYGIWLSVAIVLSLADFGNLGLAPAVITDVAAEYARKDLAGIRATVSTALLTLTAVGLVALATVLLCGGRIVTFMHLQPALAVQARSLLPFVAALSLYTVQIQTLNAVLTGLGRFDLSVGTQLVSRLVALSTSVALLFAGVGVFSLPIGQLTGYCFLHIATLKLARKISHSSCFNYRAFDVRRLKRLTTFGSGIMSCSLFNLLLGPLNKFALTRYVGPAAVPVYDLAYTLSMQLRSVFESACRALMPEISRLASLASAEGMSRVYAAHRRAIKSLVKLGLPAFALCFLLAGPFLRTWLGTRFRVDLVPAIHILMAGALLSLIGVPSYYLLLGLGRVRFVVLTHALQTCTNAILILLAVALHASLTTSYVSAAAAGGLAIGSLTAILAARWNIGQYSSSQPPVVSLAFYRPRSGEARG